MAILGPLRDERRLDPAPVAEPQLLDTITDGRRATNRGHLQRGSVPDSEGLHPGDPGVADTGPGLDPVTARSKGRAYVLVATVSTTLEACSLTSDTMMILFLALVTGSTSRRLLLLPRSGPVER